MTVSPSPPQSDQGEAAQVLPDSCPACGALPCDWVEDPHERSDELEGNDVWEILFGLLKGDVPDELTPEVCEGLLNSLREASGGFRRPVPPAADPVGEVETFQTRVQPWMMACFGMMIANDRLERGDRFIEEVYELLQWAGYPRERLAALENYVWARPVGEGSQEVGGVMVTLAAFCLAHGLDMHAAGETELARIWTKVEQIRAKQAAKPTGSALPIALAPQVGAGDREELYHQIAAIVIRSWRHEVFTEDAVAEILAALARGDQP